MTYKCEFHSEVENDYNEAYGWYEGQKKGLGERFLAFVRNKIDQIAENPEYYGVRTRKEHREVQVDVFPYLIVCTKFISRPRPFLSSPSIIQKNILVKSTANNSEHIGRGDNFPVQYKCWSF
jgi:hypothetical protein